MNIKKKLLWLMSLLLVCSGIKAADVADVNGKKYSSFSSAVTDWLKYSLFTDNKAKTLKLLANVEYSSSITLGTGVLSARTIDLNGHSITVTGSGHGFIVKNSALALNLVDSRPSEGTHYYYIGADNLAHVCESTDPEYTSAADDKKGSFTGGYITGGNLTSAGDDDGMITVGLGAFAMTGGTIIGNYSSQHGGAVTVSGGATFNMSGGNIIGNKAGVSGNAVYVSGTVLSNFNMNGGTIRNNSNGNHNAGDAAIYQDETLANIRLSGGTISNNYWGVNCDDKGTVSITGPVNVTGNVKGIGGWGTLELQGNPTIANNTDGVTKTNVVVPSGKTIDITDALSNSTPIGITMETPEDEVFTSSLSGRGNASNFSSDNPAYPVGLNASNEAILVVPKVADVDGKTYGSLSAALDDWDSNTTLKLLTDVTTDEALSVSLLSNNKTLDLNGYGLTMTASDASVISLTTGNLTIKDSRPAEGTHYYYIGADNLGHLCEATDPAYTAAAADKKGSFTGGYITGTNHTSALLLAGAITVNVGTLTMTGGTIIGNYCNRHGAVALNGGTFNMSGGNIIGNKAGVSGNAVYIGLTSSFNMTGGTITNNSNGNLDEEDAAVYLNGTSFNMSAGEISHSYWGVSSDNSGTIVIKGSSTITNNTKGIGGWNAMELQDSPFISGNMDGSTASNLHVPDGKTISITGTLSNATPIGITMESYENEVFTSGLPGKGNESNFENDDPAYPVTLSASNEARIVVPIVADVDGTKYRTLEAAVDDWNTTSLSSKTLTLLADAKTDETISLGLLVVTERTFDLNGYGVTMTATGKSLFSKNNTAKLILKDSRPTEGTHYYYIGADNLAHLCESTDPAYTATDADKRGSFTGGYLTGANLTAAGDNEGTITVSLGTIEMTGGTIIGNYSSKNGGAVVAAGSSAITVGTFTMSGGNIIGNKAGVSGNAVAATGYGKFELTGGAIISNNNGSGNAGDAAVSGADNTTVTLSGGEISHSFTGVSSSGDVTINGDVAITGNRQGIANWGTLNLSGNPDISDNTNGTTKTNLVVPTGKTITVTAALSNTNAIGITMETPDDEVFTSGLSGKGNASNFASDNIAYTVDVNSASEAVLAKILKNIDSEYTIVEIEEAVYDGGKKTPVVKVYDKSLPEGSQLLTEGTDYTLSYTTNEGGDPTKPNYVNANSYNDDVIIQGIGLYYGSVTGTFVINQRPLTDAQTIVTVNTPLTYNGADQNVTVTVQYDNGIDPAFTIDAANYDFEPKTVKEVGQHNIVITAIDNSNLTGNITKVLQVTGKDMSVYESHFTINPDPIPTQILLENMTEVTPAVTVTDNDTKEKLVKNTHYSLTYTGNNAEGNATLTITGLAPYYTGTITRTFDVVKEFFETAGISYHVTSPTTATVGKADNTLAVPDSPADVVVPATVTNADTGIEFQVTGIGSGAFASTNITSVTLPASISSIQPGAFEGADNLQWVDMHTANGFTIDNVNRTATTSPFFGVPKQALVYVCGKSIPSQNYVFYIDSEFICENFVIYDDLSGSQEQYQDAGDYKWPITVPMDFTAKKVVNTRQLTGTHFYTICLPYSLQLPATMEAYTLIGSSTKHLGFTALESDVTLEAYKPYLVKALTSGHLLYAKNVKVYASPAESEMYKLLGAGPVQSGNAYFYGTMRYMGTTSPQADGLYIMQSSGEWSKIEIAQDYDPATGKGICILPMRAYIKMDSPMMARHLTATYTNGIEEMTTADECETPVYNLQGMKINRANAKGVVIVNGKKVWVK